MSDTTHAEAQNPALTEISPQQGGYAASSAASETAELLAEISTEGNAAQTPGGTKENAAPSAFMPEDYSLRMPSHVPGDQIDSGTVGRFKEFCAQTGLSQEQAQRAVDFYFAEQDGALEGANEACESILRSQWKERYGERLSAAKEACRHFDRRMQGRLMPLLSAGLGSHPVFGELMAMVGESMAEDRMGGGFQAAPASEAVSTEEFLRTVVFKGK